MQPENWSDSEENNDLEDFTDVKFIKQIAKGSFGQVWTGRLHKKSFAIKVFDSQQNDSYGRESNVYKALNLRHPNILRFIRNEVIDTLSVKKLAHLTTSCIFVEYHPLGSVFKVLERFCINEAQLIRMITTTVSGLLHLHSQIETSRYFKNKEPMAHRDIKSQNILIKLDGSCAIGDFGLTVIKDPSTGQVDVPTEKTAGTVRYMAPEILDKSIDKKMVEAYQKADMYALALVMWEMATRCTLDRDRPEKYEKPYQANEKSEPTLSRMSEIVCSNRTRPEIPDERWDDIQTLKIIAINIRRCWSHNPTDRLTAQQLLAELQSIQQGSHNMQDMENRFNLILDKKISIFGFVVENSNETFTPLDPVAIHVAKTLIREGAELHIYGPGVEESEIRSNLINYAGVTLNPELVNSRMNIFEDAYSATDGTDAIVVCTYREEFVTLDYERIYADMIKPAYIFDGRKILDHDKLQKLGFIVESISNKLSLNAINRAWGSKTIS